jgi:CubicO group peptidase (beta-lactamase class C family)
VRRPEATVSVEEVKAVSRRSCVREGKSVSDPRKRILAASLPAILPLLVLGSVLATWGCASQTVDPSAAVDRLFSEWQSRGSPGAAVIVIRDGIVLKKAGYGLADLERGVPIGTDTAFRLGSVSKQFTAMAVMMLQEEGRLEYDEPITRYLPELSRFGDGITIRHLLTHTAGLPDYYDVFVELSGVARPHTRHALKLYSLWGEPSFAPGERYEYSNPGYEILALTIEEASGQSYSEFVEGRIFAALGMKSSVVFDERAPSMAKRAFGYRKDGDSFLIDDDDPLNYVIGSGGIYSTVEDLYLWDQALYGEQLVSRETLEEAFRPVRLNDGKEYPYGFGWGLEEHLGRRRVSHGGSWVGFHNFSSRYVDDGFSVFVLSNLTDMDVEALAGQIAAIYLGGTEKAPDDERSTDVGSSHRE